MASPNIRGTEHEGFLRFKYTNRLFSLELPIIKCTNGTKHRSVPVVRKNWEKTFYCINFDQICYSYEEKKFTGFLECCETVINFPFNVMKTFTC